MFNIISTNSITTTITTIIPTSDLSDAARWTAPSSGAVVLCDLVPSTTTVTRVATDHGNEGVVVHVKFLQRVEDGRMVVPLPSACYHGRQSETRGYSNENIVFQSFFMLITGQFFFFASA
jgi:hypothetical protein